MRLKLYEDAIKAKAQKKKGRRNSRRSPTPQDEPTDADAEVGTWRRSCRRRRLSLTGSQPP